MGKKLAKCVKRSLKNYSLKSGLYYFCMFYYPIQWRYSLIKVYDGFAVVWGIEKTLK